MKLTFKISWNQIHFPLLCHMLYSCCCFFLIIWKSIKLGNTINYQFYFFLFLFFNWWEIAVQCCIVFCHTTMQIRQIYIYISLPCWTFLLFPHPIPLGHCGACPTFLFTILFLSLFPFFSCFFFCFWSLNTSLPCSYHGRNFALIRTQDSKMTTSFLQWKNLQPRGGHTGASNEL